MTRLDWILNPDYNFERADHLFNYTVNFGSGISHTTRPPAPPYVFFGVKINVEILPNENESENCKFHHIVCAVFGDFSLPFYTESENFGADIILASSTVLWGFLRGVLYTTTAGVPGGPFILPSVDLSPGDEGMEQCKPAILQIRANLDKILKQMDVTELVRRSQDAEKTETAKRKPKPKKGNSEVAN